MSGSARRTQRPGGAARCGAGVFFSSWPLLSRFPENMPSPIFRNALKQGFSGSHDFLRDASYQNNGRICFLVFVSFWILFLPGNVFLCSLKEIRDQNCNFWNISGRHLRGSWDAKAPEVSARWSEASETRKSGTSLDKNQSSECLKKSNIHECLQQPGRPLAVLAASSTHRRPYQERPQEILQINLSGSKSGSAKRYTKTVNNSRGSSESVRPEKTFEIFCTYLGVYFTNF